MLPSICAPSSVLLMVYLVGVASSTEGGGSNQMLQPASLLELTVEEIGLPKTEAITMNLFMWLYNMTADVTYLTICTEESLIGDNENVKAGPILLYQLAEASEMNIEGQVLAGNSSCSLFTMNGIVLLSKTETIYELNLIVTKGRTTIYKSGNISFAMPVVTSILSCRNEIYTRAAGLPSGITFDSPSTCINDDQQLSDDGDDGVCYLEGEFSDSYLCYNTTDLPELHVCLQGSSLNTTNEVDGQLTISYLAYGNLTDPATAHLSLEFDQKSSDDMEAIIWKDKSLVTICQNTNCFIPDFTPGFVHYDVCAVMVDGLFVDTTSTDNITDLGADAFTYSGSPLLQFGYTNANADRYYLAYVFNDTIDSSSAVHNATTVDCSAVPLNKTCHGYFEATCSGDLMVAVEYSDPEMENKGNKIIFPCQSITETRR